MQKQAGMQFTNINQSVSMKFFWMLGQGFRANTLSLSNMDITKNSVPVSAYVINCSFTFLHDANKPTTLSKNTWKISPRTTFFTKKRCGWPFMKNDRTQLPRLMELGWLLISAAALVNYPPHPPTQILLYLGKLLIYFIWLASRYRWMSPHRKLCGNTKA